MARYNMGKSEQGRRYLESGQVEFVTADGRLGWKEGAPYDAIHVGAAAEGTSPFHCLTNFILQGVCLFL